MPLVIPPSSLVLEWSGVKISKMAGPPDLSSAEGLLGRYECSRPYPHAQLITWAARLPRIMAGLVLTRDLV